MGDNHPLILPPRRPCEENSLSDMDEAARRLAIREENRKLRYLRFMVDLVLQEIRSGSFSLSQAQAMVENLRRQALLLFPGKETAFDIIYRPRFQRAITETFQLH
jgi:hypothetical protein